jgi:hypothetical protein
VFYLSGAINVLLLLIARSQLLLLTRPKVDDQPEKPATPQSHEVNGQPEIELTQLNGNAAHAAVSDNEHGPGPMVTGLTALPEAGSSNSTPLIV